MQEQFVNEFMARVTDLISDADLNIVYKQLMIHVSEYDIRKKSTEVAIYEGYLPECYEVFFVTRKIEGMSMKSLELYNMVLRHFFYCLNKKVEEITTNDIRVYLYKVQQERQLSNATLDSRRTIIHSFLEWAANEQYIGSNPCRSIRPIKYERPKRNPLTAIELEMLRNTCQTIRDAAIIEFLYSTGCRVTEMERADITDVDFAKKEVLLLGKGNKHRISYINARAELALKKYLEIREDDSPALFVSERKPHGRIKGCNRKACAPIRRNVSDRQEGISSLNPAYNGYRRAIQRNASGRGTEAIRTRKYHNYDAIRRGVRRKHEK